MASNLPIACHDCDLLQRVAPLPEGGAALCPRCGAVLHRHKCDSLNRTLAYTVTGLALLLLANIFPFLTLRVGVEIRETTLITGAWELYLQGARLVAALVILTTLIVPLLRLVGALYVLVPLKLDRVPWGLAPVFRGVQSLQPWGMMEVFMIAILVSLVKLGKMGTIIPGIALYSFLALIFAVAASAASLDPHLVWERLDPHR